MLDKFGRPLSGESATEDRLCGAENMGPAGLIRCTRERNHPGDHIAAIGPYVEGEAYLGRWSSNRDDRATRKDLNLGATGQFPRGAADADDEGELRLALAADHQQAIVRIVFGKPIAWLGLPSAEARQLAAMLIEKANELDARKT